MGVAEKCCRENCGGPEADTRRERKQPVSTSAELFPQSDQNENQRPRYSPLPDVEAVERDAVKMEDPDSTHSNHQSSNRRETQQSALPELHAEHRAPGQAVIGNGPALDTSHNPTGRKEDEEVHHFADK